MMSTLALAVKSYEIHSVKHLHKEIHVKK